MTFKITKDDALIIVDVQNCFCPGGAVPVNEGNQVISILNKYIEKFQKAGAKIYATRDWHPPNHESFKDFGGKWPPHCVQGSEGAKFHPDLEFPIDTVIISKGDKPSVEGYSGFDHTELENKLKKDRVERIFVGGLATDYCVKHTILDALKRGFKTILLTDATKGVNEKPNDVKKAINQMLDKGVKPATISEVT